MNPAYLRVTLTNGGRKFDLEKTVITQVLDPHRLHFRVKRTEQFTRTSTKHRVTLEAKNFVAWRTSVTSGKDPCENNNRRGF